MRQFAFAIALLTISLACVAARAAELELPPSRPSENVSMQKGPPNCSRWSDGCVNCARDDKSAEPVCSNIGIACQPKAITCLSRASAPKP